MSRILRSLMLTTGAGLVIVGGVTGAFFSDTETSTGNSFTAGAIDLLIDNESYYNKNVCADVDQTEGVNMQWVGDADYPVPGTPCDTSFPLGDLDDGLLFFNFTDLKPDDEGEDTISIHVQNDAWACMDVTLTSSDDVSSNEPELGAGDEAEDVNDTWDGELAKNLEFIWWADDGDNVLEDGENLLTNGVQTLADFAASTSPFSIALADAQNNAWGNEGEPLPANDTVYIAKAWCFGDLETAPLEQDGFGEDSQNTPANTTGGITCDGTLLDNKTQTDRATLDVAFRAEQARNNDGFLCNREEPRLATITVIKEIVNDNGGNNIVADFQLFVDNGIVATPVTHNTPTNVAAGNYTVGETGISGYVASFSGDCDSEGNITLAEGDNKTCTITNNDLPANITLIKNVINNNGGVAGPTQFGLRVDGGLVQNNTSVAVTSNAAHAINEDGRAGYTFVSITGGAKCPAVLGGTATLDEGEALTCTITNDDI